MYWYNDCCFFVLAQDSELTSLTSSEAFQESDVDRIEEVAMETEEEEEEKDKEDEMIMNGDVHVEGNLNWWFIKWYD